MLPELEPYIAKYYDRWLNYSQYICTHWGIRREAYDIVGDVMEELCQKPDIVLVDFLREELQGNKKLCNYVKRMVLFTAADVAKSRMQTISTDSYIIQCVPGDDHEQSSCTDAMREAEAALREDSFIIPERTSRRREIKGSICIVFRGPRFRYRANVSKKIKKEFRSRHEALQFLMSH